MGFYHKTLEHSAVRSRESTPTCPGDVFHPSCLGPAEGAVFSSMIPDMEKSNVTNEQVFQGGNLNRSYKVLASPEGITAN